MHVHTHTMVTTGFLKRHDVNSTRFRSHDLKVGSDCIWHAPLKLWVEQNQAIAVNVSWFDWMLAYVCVCVSVCVCISHRWLFTSTFSPWVYLLSLSPLGLLQTRRGMYMTPPVTTPPAAGGRHPGGVNSTFPHLLLCSVLLRLFRVGVQAVFGARHAVVLPEGLVKRVQFRHQG